MFALECTLCEIDETWTTADAAQAAAVWHVYLQHRPVWNAIMGDRPPEARTPPEAYGERMY